MRVTVDRYQAEIPVPFPDCLGLLRLPYPLSQEEAERIKLLLDALVLDSENDA